MENLREFPKPIRIFCSWISTFAARLYEANPDMRSWEKSFSVPESVLLVDSWMDSLAKCLVAMGLRFNRLEYSIKERKVLIAVQWSSEVAAHLKGYTPMEMML